MSSFLEEVAELVDVVTAHQPKHEKVLKLEHRHTLPVRLCYLLFGCSGKVGRSETPYFFDLLSDAFEGLLAPRLDPVRELDSEIPSSFYSPDTGDFLDTVLVCYHHALADVQLQVELQERLLQLFCECLGFTLIREERREIISVC